MVVSVFWAMNTTRSTSSRPSPTVPTHTPLVRDPRSGFSGCFSELDGRDGSLGSGDSGDPGAVGWVSGCSFGVLTTPM